MKMKSIIRFLDEWHVLVFACGAVVLSIYLLFHDIPVLLGKQADSKQTSQAAAAEFLLVTVGILLIALLRRLDQVGQRLIDDVEELKAEAARSDLERFRALKKRLDPNFEKIYGEHVERELERVIGAIESGRITLNDMDELVALYKRVLKLYAGSEFWSTSIPAYDFGWRDASIAEAINRFINEDHGRMKRVFYVAEASPSEEENEIMRQQAAINVDVYYVPLGAVPGELRALHLIDADGRIAWRLDIDARKRISEVTATVDEKDIKRYQADFRRLLELHATSKFQPSE